MSENGEYLNNLIWNRRTMVQTRHTRHENYIENYTLNFFKCEKERNLKSIW